MSLLEKHLHSRTFLVGHAATLADIVGVCNLYFGYTKVPQALATGDGTHSLEWSYRSAVNPPPLMSSTGLGKERAKTCTACCRCSTSPLQKTSRR